MSRCWKPELVLGEGLLQLAQLVAVEVEDVGSPRAADLDIAQAEAGAILHCRLKSSEISSMNPESVHMFRRSFLESLSSFGQVGLYQVEVALDHGVQHRSRWRLP